MFLIAVTVGVCDLLIYHTLSKCAGPTFRKRRASSQFTGRRSAVIRSVEAWEWEWLSPWNGTRHNTQHGAMCRAYCACALVIVRRYQHAWLRRAPFLLLQEAEGGWGGRLREEEARRTGSRLTALLCCGRLGRKQDYEGRICWNTALLLMRVDWRRKFLENALQIWPTLQLEPSKDTKDFKFRISGRPSQVRPPVHTSWARAAALAKFMFLVFIISEGAV